MNGQLAQIVALVAYGNLFLRGGDEEISINSTLKYVSEIVFARYKDKNDSQGVQVASNVPDWFSYLRTKKANRLWSIVFAWERQDILEHIAVAFANGVPIAIQVDLPEGFELWYPQWKTVGSERKSWAVEYRSLMFPYSHIYSTHNLIEIKGHLRSSISQAIDFVKRPDVNAKFWENWFSKSLELMDSLEPIPPFHPDIFPASGFKLEAKQLMAAAMQAYVFGGMGSWNDLGFKNPDTQMTYEEISKKLYEAVKLAIMTASNSFSPDFHK